MRCAVLEGPSPPPLAIEYCNKLIEEAVIIFAVWTFVLLKLQQENSRFLGAKNRTRREGLMYQTGSMGKTNVLNFKCPNKRLVAKKSAYSATGVAVYPAFLS